MPGGPEIGNVGLRPQQASKVEFIQVDAAMQGLSVNGVLQVRFDICPGRAHVPMLKFAREPGSRSLQTLDTRDPRADLARRAGCPGGLSENSTIV